MEGMIREMDTTNETMVANGAKLLDSKIAGWWHQIDLEALHLSSCLDCMLGQLFGSYDKGLTDLGITETQAQSLGFNAHGGLNVCPIDSGDIPGESLAEMMTRMNASDDYWNKVYAELAHLWRLEITSRQTESARVYLAGIGEACAGVSAT